jgi:ribosomal peptide maturation radical SAM protein 1
MSASEVVLQLESALRRADVLIIVPPFANLDRPSLAAHLLQSIAGRAGIEVAVLYANVLLAATMGVDNYAAICRAPPHQLLGERFFARSAYGLAPLGEGVEELAGFAMIVGTEWAGEGTPNVPFPGELPLPLDRLRELEALVPSWLDTVATAVAQLPVRVVGCTTTFEQTAASFALLARIKQTCPEIVTIIGGANCEGVMAEGMASLDPSRQIVDFIFSGESEGTFLAFLNDLRAGKLPATRIIRGEPLVNLDDLPTSEFTDYYEQRDRFLRHLPPPSRSVVLPYETSRGCWWGQKHHCTFCGLNGEGMAFRRKSPDKVIRELRALLQRYPCRQVAMADNIMPRDYFRTLLPVLAQDPLPVQLFYEQKANLTLNDVVLLKRAGITAIQPGIESLSSSLLKLMVKGVSSRQNIALLRYARSVGLDMYWNLLWGFPGDQLEAYQETLALLPLLHHLEPPQGLCHVTIDRFSPYFDDAARYGITKIRPFAAYSTVLPKYAEVEKIAYHFIGEYACGSHDDLGVIQSIAQELTRWQSKWAPGRHDRPVLSMTRQQNRYIVIDTRGVDPTRRVQEFDKTTAALIMAARPYASGEDPRIDLAIEHRLGVLLDSCYVPLATAEPELLAELAEDRREWRVENTWLETKV